MQLNVKKIAFTTAILWGLFIFGLTWWIIFFEGQTREKTLIGKVYRGYSISAPGSVVGALWGFADGLLGGALFAWIFNFLTRRVDYVEK